MTLRYASHRDNDSHTVIRIILQLSVREPLHAPWLCLSLHSVCFPLAVCLVHFLLPPVVRTHRHMLASFPRECKGNRHVDSHMQIKIPVLMPTPGGNWLYYPQRSQLVNSSHFPWAKCPGSDWSPFPFSWWLPRALSGALTRKTENTERKRLNFIDAFKFKVRIVEF